MKIVAVFEISSYFVMLSLWSIILANDIFGSRGTVNLFYQRFDLYSGNCRDLSLKFIHLISKQAFPKN